MNIINEKINNFKSKFKKVLIVFLGGACYYFSGKFDLLERFVEFSNNYENFELDEFLIVLIYLAIVFLIALIQKSRKLLKNEEELMNKSDRLEKALSEKLLLIREVNHRIKNNISSIEGILSLSEESILNIECKKDIKDVINRVQCFRIIYDKLTYSNNDIEIEINEYLNDLISSILKYLGNNSILVDIDILEMCIHVDDAIPIGMIVNELLTNSLKYCNAEKKKIIISLKKINEDMVLTVSDNGYGYSIENPESTNSLGMMIIEGLASQLGGVFSVSNINGFCSTLKFNLKR